MILSYTYLKCEGFERDTVRRAQSECAAELLRRMLSIYNIKKYSVERDGMGRPYLPSMPSVDFNISHAGDVAVCALSVGDGRVGVDIERTGRTIPPDRAERFAKRFFSEGELKRNESLATVWTKKEAYLKYLGIGLNVRLRDIDPEADPNVRFEIFELDEYTVTVCLGKSVDLEVIPEIE